MTRSLRVQKRRIAASKQIGTPTPIPIPNPTLRDEECLCNAWVVGKGVVIDEVSAEDDAASVLEDEAVLDDAELDVAPVVVEPGMSTRFSPMLPS